MNEQNQRAGPWTGALAVIALASSIGLAVALWTRPRPSIEVASEPPVVIRTPGGLLEVSGISSTEIFTRRSMLVIAGINLGTTVSEIRVPVTYRYQIQLAKDWHPHVSGGRFLIIVPEVHPSLPVGIDTSKMVMQTTAGWMRFNGRENLDTLLAEISPALAEKAASGAYVNLQRETARKTVTEFATKWLITQERWKGVRPDQIRVYFADEPVGTLQSLGADFTGAM